MLRAAIATPLGHDVGACLAPPNCPYQEPVRTELIDLRFDCSQLFSRSRSQRRQGFESETLASEEPSGFEPDENWHSSSVEMIAMSWLPGRAMARTGLVGIELGRAPL